MGHLQSGLGPTSWPGPHTGFNVAVNFASPHVLLVIAHPRDSKAPACRGCPLIQAPFTLLRHKVRPPQGTAADATHFSRWTPPKLADFKLRVYMQNWITQVTTEGNILLKIYPMDPPTARPNVSNLCKFPFGIYMYICIYISILVRTNVD